MKKVLLLMAVFTTVGMVSCGGGEEAEADEKMDLCKCYSLKDKYDSQEEAEEDLGKDKVKECMDLMKDASMEDMEKCE